MTLRVTVAGRVGIEVDGIPLGLTGLGRAGRLMLAYLTCERHRPVSRDELADAIWGEELPRSWEQMLRGLVSKLRLTLNEAGLDPAHALATSFGAYQLNLPADARVDIEEAAAHWDEAGASMAAGDAEGAFEAASAAVRVAAQQFFPGATGAWIERRQADLRDVHVRALEVLSRAASRLGRAAEAVAAAEEAVALESYRESAYVALMNVHTDAGNRAEALRTYERCRRVLAEELGVDPSPATEATYLALLREEAPSACGAVIPPMPLPPALAPVPGSFLVGRETELERLNTAFKRSQSEGRQVVLLAGEAGIGKSTLVSAAAREAHAQGARVLYGRCDEDLEVPYQPFAEALSHFVAHASPSELAAHVAGHGSDVARLAPELARRVAGAEPPAPTDPEADRYRLFEAVAKLLADAGQANPLILVLDDLHWATQATLQLLRHVLRSPASASTLILGTFRHTEISDPLADTLADLRREPSGVERLLLGGLDTGAVKAFMAASGRLDKGPSRTEAEAVQAHTAGNPFFVGELLRHLTEIGASYRRQGPWSYYSDREDLGVPEGVQEVVARRLRRLSEAANQVVVWASVIGAEFDVGLLERASEVGDAFDAVEEAVRGHVVVEVRPGHYRFSHAIVRDTVYAGLTGTRRARLHRKVGEAIEAATGASDASRLPALAYHFAAAAPAGCAPKAADYALAAARQAIAEAAWEEAAALLERGLAALDTQDPPDLERRCELLILLAETWTRYFDPPRVIEVTERALDAARALGKAELLARAIYWRVRTPPPDLWGTSRQVALAEEALARLSERDSALRAKILAVSTRGRDPQDRVPSVRLALNLARRSGDLDALGVALCELAGLLRGSPDAHEFRQLSEELAMMAPADGWDGWRNGHHFRAMACLALGDRDGFEQSVAACHRFGAERGFWYFRHMSAMQTVTLALLDGRFDDVEPLSEQAAELDPYRGQEFMLRQLYRLHVERGDITRAATAAVRLVEDFGGPRGNTMHDGMLAAARAMQDVERHRKDLERFADEPVPRWSPERIPVTLAYKVEVAVALGGAGRAERLYETFAPYRNQIVIGGMGDGCQGAVDRFLGMLASELGRFDDGEEHFEVALAMEEGLRAPPLVARTSYWYGRMLARRGEPEGARPLVRSSLKTAEQLGMKGLAADTESLLAQL